MCEKKSPLCGKKILYIGDSICEAWCEVLNEKTSKQAGWAGRINLSTGAKGINVSRGGASLSSIRGELTMYTQLIKETANRTDYEMIVIHGGVNDGWDSAPVGKISDSRDEKDFDFSTYSGGLEKTISTAKRLYPEAKLVYIINARTNRPDAGRLADMSEYWKEGKKICAKWGVPYIDLYNIPDISDIPTCCGDHIHPDSKGYDMITPYIEKFLEEQF